MKKLTFNQRYDFIRSLVLGLPMSFGKNDEPKGVHSAQNPDAPVTFRVRWKGVRKRKKGTWRNSTFGLAFQEPNRRKQWVNAPDHRETHLRHKRGWRPNPYGQIAEKMPGKLAKINAPSS